MAVSRCLARRETENIRIFLHLSSQLFSAQEMCPCHLSILLSLTINVQSAYSDES